MNDVRVRLSTLFITSAIVGAGAFAAGRSTSPSSSSNSPEAIEHEHEHEHAPAAATLEAPTQPGLPIGHPPTGAGGPAVPDDLPPGHPSIDPGGAGGVGAGAGTATAETNVSWKVPPRWKVMPNTSAMRLATYQVPRAPGDVADGEVSVMQAGGSVQANVDRWIDQFGPDAKKTAKQTTKATGGFEVTLLEVEGPFAGGGMGGGAAGAAPEKRDRWALLGAIVVVREQRNEMPHFFKITGPPHTVQQARADLDALLASMTTKTSSASGSASFSPPPTPTPAPTPPGGARR